MEKLNHWNHEAERYDEMMGDDPTLSGLHDAIVDRLPMLTGPVLDLGCGTGLLLHRISRLNPSVELIGLDPSPEMCDITSERVPNAKIIDASADLIPLPDASVSTIISNFALHHLEHSSKADCSREIERVLQPGGMFLFGDQHLTSMGEPEDPNWQEEVLDLFVKKARYYLRNASSERMLLQIRLLPRFLTRDGEIPSTPEYWVSCLENAGLNIEEIYSVPPAELLNRVIVAKKNP